MKQKTRIASKLFAALVVLTLISCCFLGTTMARYTSAGTGKAAVQVAKWNIALNGTDTMDDETEITSAFNKLSPNMDAYNTADMDYSVENPRTNVIGDVDKGNAPMLVATLENRGDVDAKITVSWTAPECRDSNSSAIANFGEYNESAIEEVFSLQLYYGTTPTWSAAYGSNLITSGDALDYILQSDGEGDTLYIFATVTWTSDTSYASGTSADERDTWIGENVVSVAWDVTYTAVQASELP